MVGSRAYDFMYRHWAPWDSVGVRGELRQVLERGLVTPVSHPRAVDLGCGTGANVVHLAAVGFQAWGIDFSPVALDKARRRAEAAGVDCDFVEGDLTGWPIPGVSGPFDFLIDFGTLDDLKGAARERMAATIGRLARPGAMLLEWCFYGPREELPRFSFSGPSRYAPTIEPGELERLFGDEWDIEPVEADPARRIAWFLLRRR